MSYQRSFKIGSIRFAAFDPKKIENINFLNKIPDQNKPFLSVPDNLCLKAFVLVCFQKIF